MAESAGGPAKRRRRRSPQTRPETVRSFRSRGVNVEIREAGETVELSLDGHVVPVTKDGDEYHSQLANQFMAFPSIDAVVETLLANEGRTWTLHGHVCDERCTGHAHHTDNGPSSHSGHAPQHDHDHGPEHNHGEHEHDHGQGGR